ncbi:MAG: sulfite exporter TauE/SafE family protein, partial [Flavobacteriales bacterium TMED235]
LMLVIGSIVGVQVGQKIGEKINSSGLRALMAVLILVVGIAIAYDTFFSENIQNILVKETNSDLNFFSNFIIDFSKDMPFFYGLFSIMFAIFLGVGAALIRRFASNLKIKAFNKSN